MDFKRDEMIKFLQSCILFLDEADHVLIEQAESLLYIATQCPSYTALHPLFFHVQFRVDYHENFSTKNVSSKLAI